MTCEGLEGTSRDSLSRTERICLARSHQAESDHCVYYTTFPWRNGKYPPGYDLSLYDGRLTQARQAILREFLRGNQISLRPGPMARIGSLTS